MIGRILFVLTGAIFIVIGLAILGVIYLEMARQDKQREGNNAGTD